MTAPKSIFLLTTFLLVNTAVLPLAHGQSENQLVAERVTLCNLAQHPERYNGKMVEVRATVTGGPDLSIDDFEQKTPCSSWMGVRLVLPDQVSPKPGFDVIRDDAFKRLFDALHSGMNVQGTFKGQFEAVYTRRSQKQVWIANSQERGKGFGKKGQYGACIVLHSLSDVRARPVPRK